jgi:hypothetical protein
MMSGVTADLGIETMSTRAETIIDRLDATEADPPRQGIDDEMIEMMRPTESARSKSDEDVTGTTMAPAARSEITSIPSEHAITTRIDEPCSMYLYNHSKWRDSLVSRAWHIWCNYK